MKLIVGLGNPGSQYRTHRHNVGFMVLDRLHERAYGSEWRDKHAGLLARAVSAGREISLLKPQTFMNLSGRSVMRAVQQMGLAPQDILVVHDELELPFGDLRAKQGGGHGGHNGLRDITAAIGGNFARLRVGIGRPEQGAVDAYVLSAFSKDESPQLDAVLDGAVAIIETVFTRGLDAAIAESNSGHGKKKQLKPL